MRACALTTAECTWVPPSLSWGTMVALEAERTIGVRSNKPDLLKSWTLCEGIARAPAAG